MDPLARTSTDGLDDLRMVNKLSVKQIHFLIVYFGIRDEAESDIFNEQNQRLFNVKESKLNSLKRLEFFFFEIKSIRLL